MTDEERAKMNAICLRIQDEKDPQRLSELVKELDRFFEQRADASKARKLTLAANRSLSLPSGSQ